VRAPCGDGEREPAMRVFEETLLSLELPYRERLALRRTVFEGGAGPRVAVVSGIHGDELEGLYLCHRLAGWLDALAKRCPDALLGRVELHPALNTLGLDTLERSVPVYDVDLNRSFPGHAEGLLPQRIADAAMRSLEGCSLVIDVHASNIFLREIPQVRISTEFSQRLVPMARGMNLDVIWVHGAVTVLENTIAHSLNSRGVPCLVVEMGVGQRITPQFTQQVLTGILHSWRSLGVLAGDLPLPDVTHQPLLAHDGNVHYLNAATSGLFVPEVDHWMTVRKDERLGVIVSPHAGEVLSEVRSPIDGVLFTLREYPLVYEGSLMARIVDASA
jgi:predicted deacylase